MTPTIAVVGTGPVGRAVARRHTDARGRVSVIVSRTRERAESVAERTGAMRGTTELAAAVEADVVIVAVCDSAVTEVGARLAAIPGAERPLLLHTSGALTGEDLASPPCRTGSLHPLQSLPAPGPVDDPEGALAVRLAGAHWFHEGAGRAAAAQLVAAWGGTFHALAPGGKALYHAGAAILSNHTVALMHAARRLFAEAGVRPADAHAPLATLLLGTARNVADVGLPDALTGPVSRGDVATVEMHLAALRDVAPELLPSYVEMARLAVAVAIEQGGVDAEREVALRELLDAVPVEGP